MRQDAIEFILKTPAWRKEHAFTIAKGNFERDFEKLFDFLSEKKVMVVEGFLEYLDNIIFNASLIFGRVKLRKIPPILNYFLCNTKHLFYLIKTFNAYKPFGENHNNLNYARMLSFYYLVMNFFDYPNLEIQAYNFYVYKETRINTCDFFQYNQSGVYYTFIDHLRDAVGKSYRFLNLGVLVDLEGVVRDLTND